MQGYTNRTDKRSSSIECSFACIEYSRTCKDTQIELINGPPVSSVPLRV